MKSLSCPNRRCPPSASGDRRAIIRHGFYTTLGFRRDRRLVPALVFDGGRQRELPQHARPFRDVSRRMNLNEIPLVVTDGFGFYEKVVRRVFGSACLQGQVIRTRRNDRIVKVDRTGVPGDGWRLKQALRDSEESVKLNTSFVERLNLTIRQGSAYPLRWTLCHAQRNAFDGLTHLMTEAPRTGHRY